MNTRTCIAMAILWGGLATAGAGPLRLGIVPAPRIEGEQVVPDYQQRVWENTLRPYRMFETAVLDEADLEQAESLSAHVAIVVPSARRVLTRRQMEALRTYVAAGGILVRDNHAVQFIDLAGSGIYGTGSAGAEDYRETAAEVNRFWAEMGGALAHRSQDRIFIDQIRFPRRTGLEQLAAGLPEAFTPAERDWSIGAYYTLRGGSPVIEIRPGPAERPDAADLPAVLPVVVLHAHGNGYVLSYGLDIRYLRPRGQGERLPTTVHRDFFANLVFWLLDEGRARAKRE